MTAAADGIILIEGRKDLLLVAPHGHPKDDENTADFARKAASRLGCQAIVNFVFRKPRGMQRPDPEARLLNLNKSDQAAAHPRYLEALRSAVDTPERTLVLWVHGIKDKNIEAEAVRTRTYDDAPNTLLVLAGYGQGTSPKTGRAARHTARPETADRLVRSLTANGLGAVAVRDDAPTYRGRHEDFMNQWFLQNGYPLASVESIQLELKFTGVRDRDSLEPASKRFADCLKELI
jgi:hypothetical protein